VDNFVGKPFAGVCHPAKTGVLNTLTDFWALKNQMKSITCYEPSSKEGFFMGLILVSKKCG
jgi:hypothetical protein